MARLRTYLVASGSAWDPDASRLRGKLLPLTDHMTATGGLAPALRCAEQFLARRVGAPVGRPSGRKLRKLLAEGEVGGLVGQRFCEAGEVGGSLSSGDVGAERGVG